MVWNILNSVAAIGGVVLAWHAIRESHRVAKAMNRPELIFCDKHDSSDLMTQYGFYVRNVGKATAVNIDFPDEYLRKYSFLAGWRQIRRDLGPGDETKCAMGPTRFEPSITDLVITYEETDGTKHQTTFRNKKLSFS